MELAIAQAKKKPLADPSAGTGRGNKTDDNISRLSYGTSREYLAARLSRDCPEVLDQIGKGKKYRSVRAAAIAKGIIKPKISIQIDPDSSGSQIAGRLHQKLTDEQMIEIRDELNQFYGVTDNK